MRKVHVSLKSNSYDVLIESNILFSIDKYIDTSREIVIITDDNIPKIYLSVIQEKIPIIKTLFIPNGEKSKSMEMAYYLLNALVELKAKRDVLLIALGGGVVGDLVGFVASIYMRGVDYIQVPTTLLSQIDSSVGGKVAVNAEKMKNAIGSFKQPLLVLIDSTTLNTLEDRHISNGIAEMIKYGLITSKSLFKDLYTLDILDNIEDYIYKCISIKRDIVIEDEKDYGIRQLLNLGHTIGHALEQYSNYSLLHGEAIGLGMLIMAREYDYYDDLRNLLIKYNLPVEFEYDKDAIYEYITTDKKATKNKLNMIIVEEVGKGYIKTIKIAKIRERL